MHDQNFKNLILDYPREALAFFAQEETGEDLNHARIIPIRQEQLKDRLGDRFRELDVPLLVEWPNGDREAIVFVLEEETQSNRFSIHRLAHYCLDLAELMETDRVIPVVIFLNAGTRRDSLRLGGDRHSYLEFHYLACDLKRLAASDYKDSSNIIARLNLPNMNYPKQERLQIYLAAQLGLLQMEPNPNKQRKYVDFIDYYADLSEQEMIEYQTYYLNDEGEIMGFAQHFRQEGRQEGHQEGLQEGLQKGRKEECISWAASLLRRKFGIQPVLDPLLMQLQTLPVEKLESLTEVIFDWIDVSDLTEWLKQHG
ncbi:DUF4351 domain-containing protein [Crenothrix polyspora]|uniref:DUF4351 domain-containing protein n=1 Tax=Crenothrix polyspora TaxID=360316 RepID=A0A1R4GZ94_9GAMM|nr:DUF4351 domain-containing protein [Crenothrix polyspora]SJM89281.1 conserved hypothetical protein [Crenothrix polyspora]